MSPTTVTTDSTGAAQVLATANMNIGSYSVQANAAGITGTTFSLTNKAPTTFNTDFGLNPGTEISKQSPIAPPTSDVLCAEREGHTEFSKTAPYKGLSSCVSQSPARKITEPLKVGDRSTDR